MIIQLVDGLFMFAAMLLVVAVLAGSSIVAVVAIENWGHRHRERMVVKEARRAMVREWLRGDDA